MTKKHRCLATGILFADVGCAPIDHLPLAGELVATDRVELTLGGCASNVALNLARLEVPVGLCGCVGDDALSDYVVHALEHDMIDTDGVKRIDGNGPGVTLIVNVQGEDRRFISTTGSNARFTLDDTPADWLNEAEILYLGGYLMMPRLEEAGTIDYFRNFQKRGKTILDVVLYGNRPYWEAIKPLLPFVDYFMPNNDEARLICGLDDPVEQAKFFCDAGAKCTVITCGESGSLYYSDDTRFRCGIFPVNFVGGAGSGDAFAAGFISALLDGADPVTVMQTASAQGMSCVRDSSTTRTVFTKSESIDYLNNNKVRVQELGTRD